MIVSMHNVLSSKHLYQKKVVKLSYHLKHKIRMISSHRIKDLFSTRRYLTSVIHTSLKLRSNLYSCLSSLLGHK